MHRWGPFSDKCVLRTGREEMATRYCNHDKIYASVEDIQGMVQILLEQVDRNAWTADVVHAINRSYTESYGNSCSTGVLHSPQTRGFSQSDVAVFQGLLKFSLNFSEIDRREDSIPPAYQETHEWIFESSPDEQKWSSFSSWLQNDMPLYWITGKEGSGKSTLMKFICHHHRTRELLALSNSPYKLYLLSFYFWNSGTTIQMSREGLIRSFLYRINRDLPSLAPSLYPKRFEIYTYLGRYLFRKASCVARTFSLERTRISIQIFRKDVINGRKKLVIFIDGLDEYHSKHIDLLDLIQSFLGPGVKVCVSSRPWVLFKEAFKTRPSLRLEYLTQSDMEFFVESKFSANPGFEVLKDLDPSVAIELIENVPKKVSVSFYRRSCHPITS
jgi:NACHT domain-containing protein